MDLFQLTIHSCPPWVGSQGIRGFEHMDTLYLSQKVTMNACAQVQLALSIFMTSRIADREQP